MNGVVRPNQRSRGFLFFEQGRTLVSVGVVGVFDDS